VRQKFTGKERDETELDFFGARYYGSTMGRFTSVDPILSSGDVTQPQSWNRYSYTYNNPMTQIDIYGLYVWGVGAGDEEKEAFRKALKNLETERDKYKVGSANYKKFNNILLAYGKEDAPGVTIDFKAGVTAAGYGDAGGGVEPNAVIDRKTGKVKLDIHVTFDTREIQGHKNDDYFTTAVAHEGRHVINVRAAIVGAYWDGKKFFAPNATTQYKQELDALSTQQFVAQKLGVDVVFKSVVSGHVVETPLYQRSWGKVDAMKLREAVNNVLGTQYNLSKDRQGTKFPSTK